MAEEMLLDEVTHAVWTELAGGGPLDMAELIERTGLDQTKVSAVATQGSQQGLIEVTEQPREELVPSEDAAAAVERGLAERQAIRFLDANGGRIEIDKLTAWAGDSQIPINEIFRWGQTRGWLRRIKSEGKVELELTDDGRAALGVEDHDEQALRLALEQRTFLDQLDAEGLDAKRVRKLLGKRSEIARIRPRTQRTVALTESGRQALVRARVKQEHTVLTQEDLQSGVWREVTLRPYDVTLEAAKVYPAKIHPLRKIMEEARHTFLEMGFTEVVSPMVESAFWNFDALFQPQDHPARDMQDTFYMAQPGQVDLPDPDKVEPVRRTHEDGWETGSEGWGYTWDPERARQVVLRTHTTAATVRSLAGHPQPPHKVFCVGWTYRNETISFKHLPVFHQVDGIIIDEQANLATLMGTLRQFYHKMGFEKVKFKPAFYPYTEPSMDVVVYMESRGKWLEMGGSGVFRPEVTVPFGCKHPVLAWGLGVERLAMLRYGFSDLRDLYRSRLDTMQEVALCR
jgi:phenylalanyl-tRNA synthetase alpha chain